MDVLSNPLDRDVPVRRPEALRGDLRLRPVDIRLRVEGLPLEVHELDDVAVDEPQTPDARARKEVRGHAPEGAQPDHDRMGRREPALARLADLREDGLATVAVGAVHGRDNGRGAYGLLRERIKGIRTRAEGSRGGPRPPSGRPRHGARGR